MINSKFDMLNRIAVQGSKTVFQKARMLSTFVSLISMLYLVSTFCYTSYASPELVSDEVASGQGYKIISYCYDSLQNNYFQPGYSLKHCDESMIYFNEYCHERAFFPVDHVCTNNEFVGALNMYIEVRGLEGYPASGYYPINVTEDANA